MRVITFLMSFWMLFISCLPCGDRTECDSTDSVIITMNATQHQEHKHIEHCSPFCACACCSTMAFPQPVQSLDDGKIANIITLFDSRSNPPHSNLSDGIWQPPRLA